MNFSNSYIQLGSEFYQQLAPDPVSKPRLLLWNQTLADELGILERLPQDSQRLADYFSGNQLPDGAEPIALAYAGHQFGHFVPQLGDGRAHLLGEIIDRQGRRRDIQLKGSGQTRFSRQGDGRCALKPAVREFIMSEALHALGVPTSRALAVVATGDPVLREQLLPGAVVTRVAASHIRVGSFQYFAARGDLASLKALTDYAIQRHYPESGDQRDPNPGGRTLRFLEAVIARQIALVVEWLRVGFIHGVMNTDNTAISGETIDFGPCAMMGGYHPGTVFSSIDADGRYAYGNQPGIVRWNMLRLAECLLPLIDSDENKAVAQVTPLFERFGEDLQQAYLTMLAAKLGLVEATTEDADLIEALLDKMQSDQLDYTQTFHHLTLSLDDTSKAEALKTTLGDWYGQWRKRLGDSPTALGSARQLMRRHNPVVIPRNHHVEAVLTACQESGNTDAVEAFLTVLRAPYQILPETPQFQDLPPDGDRNYRTFCGT